MQALHVGIAGPIATCDVAHLLDHPGHLPSAMQGASLLVSLIEELLTRGCKVSAFTVEPSLAPRPDNIVCGFGERFTLYYVPIRHRSMRFENGLCGRILDLYALERKALVAAIRRAAPDVVHAHWQYEYGWAAIDSGLPHVVTCHDSPWLVLRMLPNAYRFGRLLMARHVLRRASIVTAVSPYLVGAVRAMSRASVELVPNPLPAVSSVARAPRSPPGQARPARVAMIINGWGKRKNADRGMLAMRRLQQLHPGTECHLIGPDFGLAEQADAWAQERGIGDAFHFHGRMSYDRVQSVLDEMDLLIHPALEESFGMTIAEAMSFGIPVVAGRSSGAVPWVTGDGAAGCLVDVRSEVEIANAAAQLLSEPSAYRLCSEAGIQRAQLLFSSRCVVDGYVALYLRAIASASPLGAF
jgi:L-malate glycosyltransferase